jgi:hypothetical protein
LQDQINAALTGSSSSSQLNEQLCPLLLAQNAHLKGLLRKQIEGNGEVVSKHLDMAAEGIREQSHILLDLKSRNETLSNTQVELEKRLYAINEHIVCPDQQWIKSLQTDQEQVQMQNKQSSKSSSDLINQFETFQTTCIEIMSRQAQKIFMLQSEQSSNSQLDTNAKSSLAGTSKNYPQNFAPKNLTFPFVRV